MKFVTLLLPALVLIASTTKAEILNIKDLANTDQATIVCTDPAKSPAMVLTGVLKRSAITSLELDLYTQGIVDTRARFPRGGSSMIKTTINNNVLSVVAERPGAYWNEQLWITVNETASRDLVGFVSYDDHDGTSIDQKNMNCVISK